MSVFQPARRVDLEQRLRAMTLELHCFEHALAQGSAEATSYSEGAPAYGPEMGRYMRTIEALHGGFMSLQRGWERSDPQNRPTWINPRLHLAIVVSSGDENTGRVSAQYPTNRNPRGISFGKFVEANGQLPLFDALTQAGEMIAITQTWVFLYHAANTQVYSELSLPTSMAGARIDDWRERILFPQFDGGTNAFEAEVDDDPNQDFGFTIQRR